MNMKKFRKFIKFINYVLLPFKLILDKIRSSTTYKIIRGIIKLYAIIFVILGSGIMGLTEIDFRGYSELVHHNLEYYFSTLSDSLKRFFNWLSRKIFGAPKPETPEETLADVARKLGIDLDELKARNSKVDRIIDYNSENFGLFKDEVEEKSNSHIKTTIIVVTIIGAALGGFYYFRPDEFNSYWTWISGGIAAIYHGRNNDGSGPGPGSGTIGNSDGIPAIDNPTSPTSSSSSSTNSEITVKDGRIESEPKAESSKQALLDHHFPEKQLALTACKSAIDFTDDELDNYIKINGNHIIHNSFTNQYQSMTDLRKWAKEMYNSESFKEKYPEGISIEEFSNIVTSKADKYSPVPGTANRSFLLEGFNRLVALTGNQSGAGIIKSVWPEGSLQTFNIPEASSSKLPVDSSAAILISGVESDNDSVWSSETPKSKPTELPVEVQDNGTDDWNFDTPPKSPETFTPKIVEEINLAAVTQTVTPPDSVLNSPKQNFKIVNGMLVDHEYIPNTEEIKSPVSDNFSINNISKGIFKDGYESDSSSSSSNSSHVGSENNSVEIENHWSDDEQPKERMKRTSSEFLRTEEVRDKQFVYRSSYNRPKTPVEVPFEDPFA